MNRMSEIVFIILYTVICSVATMAAVYLGYRIGRKRGAEIETEKHRQRQINAVLNTLSKKVSSEEKK